MCLILIILLSTVYKYRGPAPGPRLWDRNAIDAWEGNRFGIFAGMCTVVMMLNTLTYYIVRETPTTYNMFIFTITPPNLPAPRPVHPRYGPPGWITPRPLHQTGTTVDIGGTGAPHTSQLHP